MTTDWLDSVDRMMSTLQAFKPEVAADWGRTWSACSGWRPVQTYALTIRGEVPIALRTGKRRQGESRAAHARRVRLARVGRRRARRQGVPVATMRRQDYWPSVSIADGFRAHEQGLVDHMQRKRAVLGRAWTDVLGFVVTADADWAGQLNVEES